MLDVSLTIMSPRAAISELSVSPSNLNVSPMHQAATSLLSPGRDSQAAVETSWVRLFLSRGTALKKARRPWRRSSEFTDSFYPWR